MAGVLTDYTERKQLEDQLVQSQRLESIGRLAGGIAHDFNNILTAISGYTELLLVDLEGSDPRRAHAEEISRASERAGALVKKLLAFSRKQFLQPRVISLHEVVADLEPMLGRLIGEDIELVVAEPMGRSDVEADPVQVEQMIVNLVVNARDAMPQGGTIAIKTETVELADASARPLGLQAGPYVVLHVVDTGIGMDEETRAHIFEPFFTTKEPGKGTGLGLATAHGMATQSGGGIEVESRPGVGTAFSVYLPAVEREHEHGRAPCPGAPSEALGSETVLLVEDEEAVRNFARRILTDGGYQVLVAVDAEEALSIFAEHSGPIDLLLTDVVLPRMSGRELAEALFAQCPHIRTLFASGYPDDPALREGIAERSASYIGKPFSGEALRQAVRAALGRDAQPEALGGGAGLARGGHRTARSGLSDAVAALPCRPTASLAYGGGPTVVVLVSLGLALIALALVPGMRRLLVVLGFGALVCALVAQTLTNDSFLIASAGVVPLLVGLLAREIAGTFDLVGAPRREVRRAQAAQERAELRQRGARDRERERRERERRRLAA